MRKTLCFIIFTTLMVLLSSCSPAAYGEPDTIPVESQNVHISSTESEESRGDSSVAGENGTTDRDNSSAELTMLFSGTFTVGTDIPPGRYVITSDDSGNIFIRSGGRTTMSAILNPYAIERDFGVPSLTANLGYGYEIEIAGINNVTFTPAITELSTTLTTGQWVVGLDIPPGTYDAVKGHGGGGNLFIYPAVGGPANVREILGGSVGVERVRVHLEEGQRIEIWDLPSVIFRQP